MVGRTCLKYDACEGSDGVDEGKVPRRDSLDRREDIDDVAAMHVVNGGGQSALAPTYLYFDEDNAHTQGAQAPRTDG